MEYGYIITAFQAAYAFGLGVCRTDDGPVRNAARILAGHRAVEPGGDGARAGEFGIRLRRRARFALGLSEAGNFPAAIKTVSEWFPKTERALATGIFNAGANIGAVVAPAVVPFIALQYGWRWSFILTGVLGFLWLAAWLLMYRRPREHPRLSAAELAHIESDPPESVEHIPWRAILPLKQTWAFAIGKFLTDPVWWFYLFWLPKFLNTKYGLTLDKIGPPLIIVYLAADVGSVGGGWLSSALLKRGWTLNHARKTAMLTCALAVVPDDVRQPRLVACGWRCCC